MRRTGLGFEPSVKGGGAGSLRWSCWIWRNAALARLAFLWGPASWSYGRERLRVSSGTATVAGCDLATQARLIRQQIGCVLQLLSADGALTADENLLVSARLYLNGPNVRPASPRRCP